MRVRALDLNFKSLLSAMQIQCVNFQKILIHIVILLVTLDRNSDTNHMQCPIALEVVNASTGLVSQIKLEIG